MRRALLAAAATLACAGTAHADVVSVPGAPAPGPSEYDRVSVVRQGNPNAKHVLVIVPGFQGGAGFFRLVGEELVKRDRGLQVWSMDRRTAALEDHSRMRDLLAGRITPQQALDYYLGWIQDPSISPRFLPVDGASVPFTREWGLRVQVEDLRRVLQRAGRGGRRVTLAGYSLGASVVRAYAAWDFGGRPGHRDFDALALIDGGGSGRGASDADLRKQVEELKTGQPFADPLGLGLPWTTGVFATLSTAIAEVAPTAPSVLQQFPLLPDFYRPPVPVTNRALVGFGFDATTGPDQLAVLRTHSGGLAASGDPRDWQDGELSPVGRITATFGRSPVDAMEWYFPRKLQLDLAAARALKPTALTQELGLRVRHARSIDDPLYAFQTDLSDGGVLRGARELAKGSRIRRGTYVDRSATTSHVDPWTAAPARNDFVRTFAPWLKRAQRRAGR